ncbi:MAG TPA: polysaccharide deacetylase family protein [Bacteroidetes bacterium]|nr:polysaccharide deacetylase family protein [Bacteroidota bacterium]
MTDRVKNSPLFSKYSAVNILTLIVIFIMIIGYEYLEWPFYIVFIPVVLYLILIVLGSVFIGFNFYFHSVCKAVTTERKIVLTFDDGPHPEVTLKLLETLEKYNLPAAFFCIGKNVNLHQPVLRKIVESGHLVANHSYSHHRWFDLFSSKKMVGEILAANKEIEQAVGKKPLLFRPPYGVTNPMLAKALQQTGMIPVGWGLRSFDTMHDKEKVLRKLKKKTKPGDIVLFHDTREKIIGVVAEYAGWLKENNFEVVRLDKMFNIEVYEEI